MRSIIFASILGVTLGAGFAMAQPAADQDRPPVFRTEDATVKVVTVARGLEHPWAMAFLPDGRLLVTERPGRMRVVGKDGRVAPPLENLPPVFASGQGGLLDVTLDPDFAANRMLYFTYAEPGDGPERGGAGTALASARFAGTRLEDVKVLFRQQPKLSGGLHFGSRVVVGPDDKLWLGLGERYRRDEAQNLNVHLGKVIRLNKDGSVPADNPFVGRNDARPEIWSYGHRNIQGMARHPQTGPQSGRVWLHEHGARGGDEINIPERGRNYGWPVITHGVDYSGAKIGIGSEAPGMEQPLLHWTPSIAPSGMAFYGGSRIPAWRGNLFVGSLNSFLLMRVVLDGTRVVKQERLLAGLDERIRDVRDGPDGYLYIATDNADGRILRIEPVN
ncbi:PQQ-dependent sugar dehydrogenase [Ferrovibrio sp.]|jgi:glucose/arabinose dehydrogenase|uniref:PQQ-dependent sugar dehydrogenase n=1 Tax=Ferrovibrio sp. TaxID=1917215 RepID=UPI0035B2EC23